MKLDKEKYIKLIMYILTKCYNKPQVGKTVLCSIMYFIDFKYFEFYGKVMTQETYTKTKKGIIPKHFKKITQELISQKQLFLKKEQYYNRTIHRYYPLIIPTSPFTNDEISVIDICISKLSNNNALSIIQYANKDPPLIMADFGETIQYTNVIYRSKNK